MSAENVKVVVRCRPMNTKESNKNCKKILKINKTLATIDITRIASALIDDEDNNIPEIDDNLPKSFKFDSVYDDDSIQKQVYDDTAYPLVESVIEGYNDGQTGCGKTWTMEGNPDIQDLRGIIPNSFSHIFETISLETGKKFLVHASYLEIYNENVRDLLGDDPTLHLNLREDPDRGVYVDKLTKISVTSADQIRGLMAKGNSHRAVGFTEMNKDSSRSHSIFIVRIESSDIDGENIKAGKLNLVDLAGSERQSKTKATGARLKEATKINLSLSALGNVISALVEGKGKHIPYRDSKLTRLLQDSLGGNTKTIMIAAVSPADYNYEETLSTLRYANRAKNIKNVAKINQDPKDALLVEYQGEIQRLKDMLEQMKKSPSIQYENNLSASSPVSMSGTIIPKSTPEYIREKEIVKETFVVQDPTLLNQLSELSSSVQQQEAKALEYKQLQEAAIKEKELVEASLKLLQEALMDGSKVQQEKEQQAKLQAERSRKKEIELQRKLERQVAEKSNAEQRYSNLADLLQAQLDAKTTQHNQALSEIRDLSNEFEQEKEQYLDTLRDSEKELKLYKQIMSEIMTSTDLERIISGCSYNENKEKWVLPHIEIMPIAIGRVSGGGDMKREIKKEKLSNYQNAAPVIKSMTKNLDSNENQRREALYSTLVRGAEFAGTLPTQIRPAFVPAPKNDSFFIANSSNFNLDLDNLPTRPMFSPAKGSSIPSIASPSMLPSFRLDKTEEKYENTEMKYDNLIERKPFEPAIKSPMINPIKESNNILNMLPTPPLRPAFEPMRPASRNDVVKSGMINNSQQQLDVNLNIPLKPAFQPALMQNKGSSSNPSISPAPSINVNVNLPTRTAFQPANNLVNNANISNSNKSVDILNLAVLPNRPAFQPGIAPKVLNNNNVIDSVLNMDLPMKKFEPAKR